MEASGGVAADVDGDGLPDLFLTNHVSPCRHPEEPRARKVPRRHGGVGARGPLGAVHVRRLLRRRPRRARGPLRRVLRRRARDGPGLRRLQRRAATASSGTSSGTGIRSSWTRRQRAGLGDAGWGFAGPRPATSTTTATTTSTSRTTSAVNAFFENRSTPGHPHFVNIAKDERHRGRGLRNGRRRGATTTATGAGTSTSPTTGRPTGGSCATRAGRCRRCRLPASCGPTWRGS